MIIIRIMEMRNNYKSTKCREEDSKQQCFLKQQQISK